jgi:hypothetical protein
MHMIFVSHRKHTYGPPTACYRDSFTFIHVNDVRTLQDIYLWASTPW